MKDNIEILGIILSTLIGLGSLAVVIIELQAAKREKQKLMGVLEDIHRLRAELHGFIETNKLLVEVQKPTLEMGIKVDYEVGYKRQLVRLLDLIEELFKTGHIIYLFPPNTTEFNLLNNISLQLAYYKESSLRGEDGLLIQPIWLLRTCNGCLEIISKIHKKDLLKSIKENMNTFSSDKERAEIARVKGILGEA